MESALPTRGSLAAFVRPKRSASNRIIAGVAAGAAEQLGISPLLVRAALLSLVLAGGLGIALYLIAWGVVLDGEKIVTTPAEAAGTREKLGLLMLLVGLLVLMRSWGLWLGDPIVWPTALVVMGIAAVWDREGGAPSWGNEEERPALGQVLLGGALMIGGAWTFVALGPRDIQEIGGVAIGALALVAGFSLVFGRWVYRLASDLTEERRERIRSEERAEMAAHLHDSVLQTLALIQRADDPKEMTVIARAQERELRDWLYGDRNGGPNRLSDALQAVADRVERDHRVPVEVIVVADFPMTDPMAALVGAAGEAMTNAARHSGANRISVYAEHTGDAVELFVSDQGSGFDPSAIAADRRGVAESIRGRMTRHGGSAEILSQPGEGTEVVLRLPVDAPISEGTDT
jgi:signal transduction histidine kinase